MKIIVLPFAGGNKYSFNFLKDPNLSFKVIEYPGRGKRFKEKLLGNIYDILDDAFDKFLINEIKSKDDYVIYGHSMGALIGYLACQKIERENYKKPIKLIVSGRKSPSYKFKKRKMLSSLPDNIFWKEISSLGRIPKGLNDPETKNLFTPILKSDIRAVEGFDYVKRGKLTIPIDVFYGDNEQITGDEILSWKNETTGKVSITKLEGNHFFIYKHQSFFINYFNKIISKHKKA